MLALVLALILLAGYATQRGSVCAVGATHELVADRNVSRYAGFLFCAACALLVLASASVLGRAMFDDYPGLAPSLVAAAGGATVGTGAFVNGRCAFGTVAELGTGRLARLATIAGFVAGAAVGTAAGMTIGEPVIVTSRLASLPALSVLIAAVAVAVLSAWWLAALKTTRDPRQWPQLPAMAAIGISNGVLLVVAAGWPYTNLLIDITTGGGEALAWRAAMACTFVAGAVIAAARSRQFAPALGSPLEWLRSLAGGMIMGIGAVLVPGGNDTMLLVGVPLLLPNLLLAYAAMSVTLIAIIFFASRPRTASRPAL